LKALFPHVASMLASEGIVSPEQALKHDGYSGARITAIEQGGARYVLKRIRYADDWLMQVVGDAECREALFAASPLVDRLPHLVRTPTLTVARDGDGWAILMRDISPLLLSAQGVVQPPTTEVVLDALVAMHAVFWDDPLADAGFDVPGAREHLRFLGPDTGRKLLDEGRDFGLLRGWERFDALAPAPMSALVRRLFADPSPLLDALGRMPQTLLHGDAKLANMGIDGTTVWMFDWSFVRRAPVCAEVAWFLAVNSSRLPWSLDETIERYRARLAHALGPERWAATDWPSQRAAMFVVGLMLYGWGKALDADAGRPEELRWWCTGGDVAMRHFGWW
jgi:Phosphotransferase enzyme family